ncbi:hypothetical protein [Photobacterium alginatilyticum]|uniref:Uncharacterized protein n=1 Tax=Photobacterium alginatilyticum TaxID=1775171 RepID=A0ABW9YMT1_9GAMM|nr:hypothetical protein [Photobacterium alginatilyticum]NBI54842.1 hypothetical protein [Photobacterium alginatilyticum]
MNDYCIQAINNMVSVSRIIDGELEPIRIRGELYLPIADFWPTFKQKVEYEADELLAFIIFSDTENFIVDPEINIADEFITEQFDLQNLVLEYLNGGCLLSFYPHIDIENIKQPHRLSVTKYTKAEENKEIVNNEMTVDSLQAFFRRKTRELLKESYKMEKGK